MIILGDSLTAGYGLEEKYSFPTQLEHALQSDGIDISIINAGVSGDTTAGGLERLAWTLDDPFSEPADILVIALGANDGLRAVPPAFTRENLENIITQARDIQPSITILLIGMLAPPNLGDTYAMDFNKIYPELAEKYDIPLYPFFLDGVITDKDLNQADGIHPNAEGVEIIIGKSLPFFKTHTQSIVDKRLLAD